MRVLRNIEGFEVMPEESQVGASAANAVVGRSVWDVQSTARSLMAYGEGVKTRRLNLAARSWHGPWSMLDKWLAGSRGVFLIAKRRANVGNRRVTARR